jgi:protoporphyrinogen oxidase
MDNKPKAIIIGAGPAGLTAAYKLLKTTNYQPIIIEESGEVGGISRTVNYNGNRMDLGGHRFFSKNTEVMNMWTDLMPVQGAPAKDDKLLSREKPLVTGGPDPENTDRTMLIRTRVSRIFYLRKFFDYPISLRLATFTNMGFARTLSAGFGYVWSAIFKRPENSLRDFMINRFGSPLYKMFFEDYTEKVWGRNPSDISASWGEQRIKSLSLSRAVLAVLKKPFIKKGSIAQKNVETSLIEQFFYPKKGPGQLWETMASEIKALGGEIRFNTTAVAVNMEAGNVTSLVVEKDGVRKTVCGDVFLSSMPIKDLATAMGDVMPADVKNIAQNLPYRDFIAVGLLVKKLNLKNRTNIKTVSNIVPDCWIYIQERDVKLGRLQVFNNWSPYMVKDLENTVWIGLEYFCNEGDDLWSMPDKAFIGFAVNELCKIGVIDRSDVIDAKRLKVKKAYPAYFGAYCEFDKVVDYLNTVENLYCIGRNGQHRYNNMDHSMLTSIAAVNNIRSGEKDKSPVWNVNTEKDYHELKSTTAIPQKSEKI